MQKRNGWVLLWLELRRVAVSGCIGLALRFQPKTDDDLRTLSAFHYLYAAMVADSTVQMERRKKERENKNG